MSARVRMGWHAKLQAWLHLRVLCPRGRHHWVRYMDPTRGCWCYWCDLDSVVW